MGDLGLAEDCEAEEDDKLPWILNGLKALSRGITLVVADESLPFIEEELVFRVGSGDAGVVAGSSGDAGVSKLSSSSSLGDSGEAGVSSTSLDSESGESGDVTDDCQMGFSADGVVSDLSSFFGLLPVASNWCLSLSPSPPNLGLFICLAPSKRFMSRSPLASRLPKFGLSNRTGPVTNSFLFCWLFAIKDQCKKVSISCFR